MQKRRSSLKFGDLAEKSGFNSVSNLSTKARARRGGAGARGAHRRDRPDGAHAGGPGPRGLHRGFPRLGGTSVLAGRARSSSPPGGGQE